MVQIRWFAVAVLAGFCALDGLSAVTPQAATAASPIVDRAAAYVADYSRALSSVVAEERYDQWLRTGGFAIRQPGAGGMRPEAYERKRRLLSDYLLVKVDGLNGWVPFRDVLEVDGKAVKDREERLATLFLENPSRAMAQAKQIAEEGARFNLGNVTRTINMPTLALMVLSDLHRHRFHFTAGDERRLAGLRTRAVDYTEVGSPTLIRTDGSNDLPASGTLWVEPDTGTVLRSVLRTNDGRLASEITVTYRLEQTLELYVPDRMEEVYRGGGEHVEGEATYTNFRRFTVETKEAIK